MSLFLFTWHSSVSYPHTANWPRHRLWYFDLIIWRCWKGLGKTIEGHSLPSPAGMVASRENFWLKPGEVQSLCGSFLLYIKMLLQC